MSRERLGLVSTTGSTVAWQRTGSPAGFAAWGWRLALLVLALTLVSSRGLAAESLGLFAGGRTEDTNSQEVLRTYLQLQEQIHATQLTIERNRQEAVADAERDSKVLEERLRGIEKSLETQRARELEAMQSSNRVMLIVAGSFAGAGFVAMLLMAYFQWRTVNGLAEISTALPTPRGFIPMPALAALGSGEGQPMPVSPAAEQSHLRLAGALERLEQRIREVEQTTRPALREGAANNGGKGTGTREAASPPLSREVPDSIASDANGPAAQLLSKGQTLLDTDKAEAALGCFEEALKLEPKSTEALLKKGTALEKLSKLEEAIECYDRALTADSSLTIAYLHKGGLFNRMERYNEALACYEQALRTQEKRAAN